MPYKEEELEFIQNMCRPEKYRQEIEDAILRGYDPPTLPPDCYDRYIECRRLHERGYSRGADGTLRRIFNTYGRSKFGATIDRIKTIDTSADHAPMDMETLVLSMVMELLLTVTLKLECLKLQSKCFKI